MLEGIKRMKVKSVLFWLASLCSVGAYAQAVIGFGTVSGTIRDPTGDGIPDTSVVLSNPASGVQRIMSTTDVGSFNAPVIPPGPGYILKMIRKGFLDLQTDSFEVQLGQSVVFEISLQAEPGSAQDSSKKPSIRMQAARYEVSDWFPEASVMGLPGRDRSVDSLASLSSGLTVDPVSGLLAFHSEAFTNALWTDGILTTNTHFYHEPEVLLPLTQDQLQQLQVVSGIEPPELGHTMGGTINLATPVGTNAIHGNVYGYYNDHSFNAVNRYAAGFNPTGSRDQFGADAGGPILRDKLFWYFSVDDLDSHSQELNHTSNPLIVNPAGTAVLPSNCAATAAQCASAISFLNAQLNRVIPTSLSSLTGLAKIDYRLNPNNSFNFELNAMKRHSPNGADLETVAGNGGVLGSNGTYTDESRYGKVDWTSVWGANTVNEVRVASVHDRLSQYSNPALLPSTAAVGLYIAGTAFGGNPANPFVVSDQRSQILDNYTTQHNGHSIKLGFDYSRIEDRTDQVFNSAGTYTYPSLTAFADDFNTSGKRDYTSFTQGFGRPVVDLKPSVAAFYAQDAWAAQRDLTVVFGFSYEKTGIPQPPYTNPTYASTGSIHSPFLDYAPRIGLAYKATDRTVVRVGAGSFFQPFPGQLLDALYTGNGIYQSNVALNPTQTGAPQFPKILPTSGAGLPTGSPVVAYSTSTFRNPYSIQYNVAVEHQLTDRLTLSADYLNNRGVRLWTAADQILTSPTVAKIYLINGTGSAAQTAYETYVYTAKTTANFSHVYQIDNEGFSSYNGLTVQLRARAYHGLTAQAAYTWSHAVDDVSGNPLVAGFVPTSSYPGQFRADQGNSAFNQKHRLVMNWTWRPTVSRNDSVLSRYILNGWQLSGIATLTSSLGETPLIVVNGQQFTGTTMAFTNSIIGSGGWSRVPFESINSLPTGPEFDVDARLTRELPFTERVRGLLMFEAFNAFNTQFNTSVNTIAYQATSGVLNPVPGVGAGNAADGFPWGSNARHLQVALRITF
jgi:hypothetical protein